LETRHLAPLEPLEPAQSVHLSPNLPLFRQVRSAGGSRHFSSFRLLFFFVVMMVLVIHELFPINFF
jgi:hypothetical protein